MNDKYVMVVTSANKPLALVPNFLFSYLLVFVPAAGAGAAGVPPPRLSQQCSEHTIRGIQVKFLAPGVLLLLLG